MQFLWQTKFICGSLKDTEYEAAFSQNHAELTIMLQALSQYALSELSCLSSRELITFHDGFAYFAHENGLTILRAVEEEAGSEASALELRELIQLVRLHDLPAIFTEINGSTSAAQIIAAETGVTSYPLDMAMGNRGYFDAMHHNIDRIKEALS
jgi:zinc transport system substrate-binding protein